LAEHEGWKEKVRRVSVMSKSEKPGDWERAQNRCLNFVQAHRVRMLIDRVISQLFDCTADELSESLTTSDHSGKVRKISGRFFADITAALDKVHHLSYLAIGDSIGERLDRKEEGGENVNAIHAALIQALNAPGTVLSQKTSEALVLEASSAISAQQTERKPPAEEGDPGSKTDA
jgi:hypothetical protein